MESTTGHTLTLWDLLRPLAYTADSRNQWVIVSHPKNTDVESQVFTPDNITRLVGAGDRTLNVAVPSGRANHYPIVPLNSAVR